MKQKNYGSAILFIGVLLAFFITMCSCKKEVTTVQKPYATIPLQKMKGQYLVEERQYIVMGLYTDTGDRYSDLPTYLTDDTYQFYREGVAIRWGNDIPNPWLPADSSTLTTNWEAYVDNNELKLQWYNVLTDEPTLYTVEELKDETCTIILSYHDIDPNRTKLYLKLSKITL